MNKPKFYHSQIYLKILVIPVFWLLTINLAYGAEKVLKIADLRTEYKTDPVGIDTRIPRLSWQVVSNLRNTFQVAYHIRASQSRVDLMRGKNILWDTRKITSDQSTQVEYQGPELKTGQRIYWQVRVWDNMNNVSGWSDCAFFEMGLLDPDDWKTLWIEPGFTEDTLTSQPCPYLRKEFQVKKKVRSARIYVSARGLYELEINGKKVGDQVFTPGWTSYDKRIQYQTFDIGPDLKPGINVIGAVMGDGWYRGFLAFNKKRNTYGKNLALILQMEVTYTDNSREMVITDGSWKSATGPILASDIYNGETYDARLEKKNWSSPGYDDSSWKGVLVRDYGKSSLVAAYGPPVRKIQELIPVKIFTSPAGEKIIDFGQNMVGFVRFRVTGNQGTEVVLKHAEVLDRNGNLYTENLRDARQEVRYVLKGQGEEVYEPRFTFQGFRYVAVNGYPGELDKDKFRGIVVHSDMLPSGSFECSDSLINQLQHNIVWGLKGNFLDVPTDCPQRNERLGWTGDAQAFAPTACFNMDAASFYIKWLKDLAADQFEDGSIPHVIPDVLKRGAAAGWADAGVIIPWTLYVTYGDKRILAEQYESMKKWVDYMKNSAGDSYLWTKGTHYGDWLAFATTRSDYPGATTDKDLIATAFFAGSTDILQKTAAILGKQEDSRYYTELLQKIKNAFRNEFVTGNGRLASNTQTAYVLALAFDLLPEEQAKIAAKRLADDVASFKHITTGFLGTPLISEMLTRYGYSDLAFMLLNRKQYPSWLYPVTMGATTIWERWDGIKPDGSFQDIRMNSFNHYAYGAIGNWLYSRVAGISISHDAPGYKRFVIKPLIGGGLNSAKAEYNSVHGKIISGWSIAGGQLLMEVTIPANTSAEVYIPNKNRDEILENGKPLTPDFGLKKIETDGDYTKVSLGSGSYAFTIRM